MKLTCYKYFLCSDDTHILIGPHMTGKSKDATLKKKISENAIFKVTYLKEREGLASTGEKICIYLYIWRHLTSIERNSVL